MKHFYRYEKKEKIELGNRLFSIKKCEDGRIRFREECDGYFRGYFSKEDTLELLQEAIDWIKEKK